MATEDFIAYYRVSTQRQGRSGLGIDAQKKAVLDFLDGSARRFSSSSPPAPASRPWRSGMI